MTSNPRALRLRRATMNDVGPGEVREEPDGGQLLGAPDLMRRTEDGAILAYFYSRFGQRDWVVYFE